MKEKIKAEKFGNNPEIAKITQEKDQYKKERELVLAQILELEGHIKGPKEQLQSLKSEKQSLQKEIEFYKVEALDAEIKSIQQKLGFSSLSVGEEKKLIDRKNRIEAQKPKVIRYAEAVKRMKTIHDSNDQVFSKLKILGESKKNLNIKIRNLSDKIKNYLDNKTQNAPNIKNLELQKDNIKAEIDKCWEKKREINNEYEDKCYYYREQQKLLKYIKEAEEKISFLKKKEEREKKWREREAKENAANQPTATVSNAPVEVEPFAYEMSLCEWLSSYFKNVIGVKDLVQSNTEPEKKIANSKIDEDISKGIIKPLTRKDDALSIGLTSSVAPKKKTKGPKISKREQKVESSGLLSLDISIIKKIQDVKLFPPSKKTEIPAFIELLQKTLKDMQAQAEGLKKTGVTESQTQVEEKKEATPLVETPIQVQATPLVEAPINVQATPLVETPTQEQATPSPNIIKLKSKITSHTIEDVKIY